MISTLKQLKKLYPEIISTSGNIYYIDGMGWYKQKNTVFGLETYYKKDDSWTAINFEREVKYFQTIHGERS